MAMHVRCGALFTGNEDAERKNQTLVIESGRLTYVGPTDKAPKAIGPYSQGIVAGELVFVSGQIPLDPQTQQMVQGDVRAQTERVMENLAAVLAAAGVGFANVVKASIFLADLNDFAAVNEVYGKRFPSALSEAP